MRLLLLREEIMPGNRKSIRLKNYDYTQQGAYYVTVCVNDRKCVFGDVRDGEMILNDAGDMVQRVWDEIPQFYDGIDIDHFQIMPNHIHGIIMIVGAGPCGRPDNKQSGDCNMKLYDHDTGQPHNCIGHPHNCIGHPHNCIGHPHNCIGHPHNCIGHPQGGAPTLSLSDVVHRFKTMTTKQYCDGVKFNNWPEFNTRLWQRNFFEHVIRDESNLNRIREYIINNPANWEKDECYR
jgi:putative transposase